MGLNINEKRMQMLYQIIGTTLFAICLYGVKIGGHTGTAHSHMFLVDVQIHFGLVIHEKDTHQQNVHSIVTSVVD